MDSPQDIRTGMTVRIDAEHVSNPANAVLRIVLERNTATGHIRVSEGWFPPKRVLKVTDTRGSNTDPGAR